MKAINEQPILFAVGINHKTASIEAREKIYIQESEIPELLDKLRETLDECVVLSTCNRTEIYGVTRRTDLDLDFYKDLLIEFKKAESVVERAHFFGLVSCAACQQLFKVATSVDSKIVGDTQILGQLRSAYSFAQHHKTTGIILNQLLQRGFKVGKNARTETDLHKGAISVSLAAVELAWETFGSLADKTVMIIGAGETAQLAAKCLLQRNVGRVLITNRTNSNASEMLDNLQKFNNFKGEVVEFSEFKDFLNETDIVISSTSSPLPILNEGDFSGQNRRILLIDIAVPRDIAPEAGNCLNVVLKNIDDLQQIVDRNFKRRMAALPNIRRIIMSEMADFLVWYYSLPLLPANLKSGTKPDRETQTEIIRTKEFLLKNVSKVHRLAMLNGAESFAGHIRVIGELAKMKEAAFARDEVEN